MPSAPTPLRAAIYCRISLDRSGKGLGVERQEQECRALAERRGWQVAEVYVDNDISAASGRRRPKWERMLADIESGRVDGLMAWHLDRLLRRTVDLERLLDTLDAAPGAMPVAFVTAGDIDLSNPSGRMLARILAAVAAQESEHKGVRVRAAREQEARAGRSNALLGYGYNADRSINPAEAAVVREVAERLLAGETFYSVATVLNARRVPTPGQGTWTYRHVVKVADDGDTPHETAALIAACRSEVAVGEVVLARLLRAAGGRQESGEFWTSAAVQTSPILVAAASAELLDDVATAKVLRAAAVPVAGRMHWRASNLRAMIRRGSLCGWREWAPGQRGGSGELVAPGEWTPILTLETTQRIRMLTDKKDPGKAGRKPKHLLSGVLRCGQCKAPMGGWKQGDGTRYGCAQQPGLNRCGKVSVAGGPVEAMVTEAVLDALADAGLRTRRARRAKTKPDLGEAERVLAEVTADRQHYAREVGAGRLSRDEYATILEGLNGRQRAAEASLGRFEPEQETALRDVPTDSAKVREWWDRAGLERRRDVVKALIEAVPIAPVGKHTTRFDPSRVGDPVWRL